MQSEKEEKTCVGTRAAWLALKKEKKIIDKSQSVHGQTVVAHKQRALAFGVELSVALKFEVLQSKPYEVTNFLCGGSKIF